MKIITVNGAELSRSELVAAGELLFLTDEEIYPTAFGTAENMGKVFPYLASIKGNMFEGKNLLVAKADGAIAGVLVGCRNAKWAPGTVEKAFTACGLPVPSGAADAEKHYFCYEAEHESGDYVLCLCVSPLFRRQGIGKILLTNYLSDKTEATLECLRSNSVAMALYEACGFVNIAEYDGYSAPGKPCVAVCKMLYRSQ